MIPDIFIQIISQFKNQHIAVIGDLMLDRYIFGSVDRISPQAPVPIVKVTKIQEELGGASNVMRNIITLGSNYVYSYGIIGNDDVGKKIIHQLQDYNINYSKTYQSNNIFSICKERVIAKSQQLLRIDYEEQSILISDSQREQLFNDLKQDIITNNIKVVIIEDYGKGLFTSEFADKIVKFCESNNIISIYDPNKRNILSFNNITVMKPNKSEAFALAGISDDLNKAANIILNKWNPKYLLISCAEEGIMIYTKQDKIHIPTYVREVYDVSGAGDTVVATISLVLAVTDNIVLATQLANYAAGVVVGKIGTATVSQEELLQAINSFGTRI